MALARKLEQFQRRRGERRQFIAIMEDITATRRASSQMLEFLSELYNSSNRESDYCTTLLKLFDLYCSTGRIHAKRRSAWIARRKLIPMSRGI